MPSDTQFNAACYLRRYPDVRNSDKWSKNPYGHYKENGQFEGRAPGCDLLPTYYESEFNGDAYLNRYPDVKQSATWKNDPYGHYVRSGAKEGRIPGYEIITPSSPIGFTTPGTTIFKDEEIPDTSPAPGDGEIYTPPDTTGEDMPTDQETVIEQPGGIMEWVSQNQTTALAIGAGLAFILLTKNKRKK